MKKFLAAIRALLAEMNSVPASVAEAYLLDAVTNG